MASVIASIFKVASKFDPKQHNDYAPNPVQREFIRLCSERSYYLGFGDTGHTMPEIQAFVLNDQTVQTFSTTGKKKVFMERSPTMNTYFDGLRSDEDMGFFQKWRGRLGLLGDWNSYTEQNRLVSVFEQSAQNNKDVQFVGVDKRQFLTSQAIKLPIKVLLSPFVYVAKNLLSLGKSIKASKPRDIVHKIVRFVHPEEIARGIVDYGLSEDQDIASTIKAHDEPCVVFYGAGHLNQTIERKDEKRSLRTLLPESDKPICVLNVCKRDYSDHILNKNPLTYISDRFNLSALSDTKIGRAWQVVYDTVAKPAYYNEYKPPDARLFVLPSDDNPHGITVINPEFQELYEQAVRNVEGRECVPT